MEDFAGVRTIARIKVSRSVGTVGADDDRDGPLALRRQWVDPQYGPKSAN